MLLNLRFQDGVSSKGFSIMELIMATGILSIIALTFLQLQSSWQKSLLNNRQIASRDSIKSLADRYILDLNVIQKSALKANYSALSSNIAGNEALDYCINGDPSGPTAQCPTGVACSKAVINQPFHILDPADPTHTKRFSGTEAASGGSFATTTLSPVRYDINGLACTSPTPDCALELVTTYNANCSAGAANCNGASEVFISYKLQNAPGVTPTSGVNFKLAQPSTPVLLATAATATSSGGTMIQIRCPFYSYVSNVGPNCQTAAAPAGLCAPASCPTGWTDAGTLSAEYTAAVVSAGVMFIGNCIRTCHK